MTTKHLSSATAQHSNEGGVKVKRDKYFVGIIQNMSKSVLQTLEKGGSVRPKESQPTSHENERADVLSWCCCFEF